MRRLSINGLYASISEQLKEIRKMDVYNEDINIQQAKINKARTIAYLVSVGIQLYEKSLLAEEVEELRSELDELNKAIKKGENDGD